MSRGGSKISKSNGHDYVRSERVSWIDQFADNINRASKTAVEVARERNEQSIHEQISSIMSRTGHATVESLVQEYHERTGLGEYLKRSQVNESDKIAAAGVDPEAFATIPHLRETVINYIVNNINTKHGQPSIPEVQADVLAAFKSRGLQPEDVENDVVAKLISDKIADAQKQSPMKDVNTLELGLGVGVDDVDHNDPDNTDFYRALMPYMGQGS